MYRLPRWTIRDVAECICAAIGNKYDFIMMASGSRGSGKSTFLYRILKTLPAKPFRFDPRNDQAYNRNHVLRLIATRKRRTVFGDEFINVLYNRDYQNKEQKDIVKALNMYRDNGNVIGGCIPSFRALDKQFRDIVKLRFQVVERGIAIVHMPHEIDYGDDKWDIKNNEKIERNWIERHKKPQYHKLTTAVGYITWKDLNKADKKLYEALKEERRGRIFKGEFDYELTEAPDPEKLMYERLAEKVKGKITRKEFTDICAIMGQDAKKVQFKLRKLLNEQGETRKINQLINDNNVLVIKDKLGFAVIKPIE